MVFDPGIDGALRDALETVMKRPAVRARLVDAGRVQAAEFGWKRTVLDSHAVYSEVADAGR